MRPTIHGGWSAHWTLLCGVIVGFPLKNPSKEPEESDHKDKKLAYAYQYEPETHLLMPIGFCCSETDIPVNIETLKKRAVDVAEEPNVNSDTHSKNCKYRSQKCQKCTIEYVDKKLDLERDAENIWVVARHRDEYVVWTLRELAESNRQLRSPSREIQSPRLQNDERTTDYIQKARARYRESLKSTRSTCRQWKYEQSQREGRKRNRKMCTIVVEQMESLSREHPDLLPSELVEMLDLSIYVGDLEGWKSAAKVAYETPLNFPRNELIPSEIQMTEETTYQNPVAPPPLPIPASPTPVTPPMNTRPPSISLDRQYVCFEPLEDQYKNDGMDTVPDVNNINDIVVKPVQFHFTINGKLASWIRKEQRSQILAAAKNRASTSGTFTG